MAAEVTSRASFNSSQSSKLNEMMAWFFPSDSPSSPAAALEPEVRGVRMGSSVFSLTPSSTTLCFTRKETWNMF